MNAQMLNSFLGSLRSHKLCDSAFYDPYSGKGAITSSEGMLPFALREKGFAVGGSSPVEMYCPNPEAALIRILSCRLFGTTDHTFKGKVYASVNCYPKAIQSDGVLFSTANGKEFITNSSNTRVTLGLYDILYSKNADSSILMLPELLPSGSDVVAIASSRISSVAVSPKTELLSSQLAYETSEWVICNRDVKEIASLNAIFSDHSSLGKAAPTEEALLECAPTALLKASKDGYQLLSRLSLGDSTYHLAEEIKPDFTSVQTAVIASNNSIGDLESGAVFSGNDVKNLLSLRKAQRPVFSRSTFNFSSEVGPSQRVSDYWGIPLSTSSIKSCVWSY